MILSLPDIMTLVHLKHKDWKLYPLSSALCQPNSPENEIKNNGVGEYVNAH